MVVPTFFRVESVNYYQVPSGGFAEPKVVGPAGTLEVLIVPDRTLGGTGRRERSEGLVGGVGVGALSPCRLCRTVPTRKWRQTGYPRDGWDGSH